MDRRRNRGPELSVAPFYKEIESLDKIKRKDDRAMDEIRIPYLKLNLIPQAKGSCFIEVGNTRLICAVYGPKQNKKQIFSEKATLQCEFKYATFSNEKREAHIQNAEEKEISRIIESSLTPSIRLDKYPKSIIQVFVTILQNDGSLSCLSNAITAASISLALANIELIDLVVASSAVIINDKVRMDADYLEEENSDTKLMVAYMPSLQLVNHMVQNGKPLDLQLTRAVMHNSLDACYKIFALMSPVLKNSINIPKVQVMKD